MRTSGAYEEFAQAASTGTDFAFLNRHAENAWVIVELLFRKANECVEILTGTLNPAIYGDERVINSAVAFLERCRDPIPFQPSLFILVENEGDWVNHPLILRTVSTFPQKLEVRQVPSKIKNTYPFHFMLADKKHFRCKKSREFPEAVVKFNTPDTGETLHQLFQQVRLKSEIIQLGA